MCWGSKCFKTLAAERCILSHWSFGSLQPPMCQHAPAWYSRKNFTKMPIHLSTTYCQYICKASSAYQTREDSTAKRMWNKVDWFRGVARNLNCSNDISIGWKMIRRKHIIMISYDNLHPNQCEIQVSHAIHPASFCKKKMWSTFQWGYPCGATVVGWLWQVQWFLSTSVSP